MAARDGDYVQQLGDVLRRRDVSALRAFLIEQAGRYGDERQVAAIRAQGDDELALLLHRMILARGDLADLHAESQRRLGGVPDAGSGRAPSGSGSSGDRSSGAPNGRADGPPRGRHPPRRPPRQPS